jgi:Holliday junction DNA helicase RuvA
MITFLHGSITEKHPTRLVLDVGGVGYEVALPLSSYDRLPAKGERCRILTYDHVREDTHQLFGFVTEEERQMFVMLMTINGIGPKLALSVLSGLSVREIRRAIVDGDVKRLSSISGIGKKTAERITLELRDKITEGEALEAVAGAEESPEEALALRDAIMALIALGYKQSEARKMVLDAAHGLDPAQTGVEDIVKRALGT